MISLREPAKRRRNRLIGKWPSAKTQKSWWYESSLEQDALRLLEWDSCVSDYETQNIQIEYIRNKKWHKYTPDILAIIDDKKIIIEVKPLQFSQSREFKCFENIIKSTLRDDGYDFQVWTEEVIRQQPRLNNLKHILPYRFVFIDECLAFDIRDWVSDACSPTFKSLCVSLNNLGIDSSIAFAAIAQQIITIDIEQLFNNETILHLPMVVGDDDV